MRHKRLRKQLKIIGYKDKTIDKIIDFYAKQPHIAFLIQLQPTKALTRHGTTLAQAKRCQCRAEGTKTENYDA